MRIDGADPVDAEIGPRLTGIRDLLAHLDPPVPADANLPFLIAKSVF